MGNRTDGELTDPLVTLLGDSDAWVRRVACEAIAHRGARSAGAGADRPVG